MTTPDRQLQRMETLRKRFGFLVDALFVREWVTWLLTRLPVRRRADATSVRIRCWSDILAFGEIFRGGIYDSVFDGSPCTTYCDLGCQSGLALLRLAARSGPPSRSLLVDGNPLAITRARANVREAGLEGVAVVHGAVGCPTATAAESTTTFVLLPNELECGLSGPQAGTRSARTVTVPIIDLEASWREHVGDVPCDLLKMDVEGAELNVLVVEGKFLERVRRCVLEWHDPPAAKDRIMTLLHGHGFTDIRSVWEGGQTGVLDCRRPTAVAAAPPSAEASRQRPSARR